MLYFNTASLFNVFLLEHFPLPLYVVVQGQGRAATKKPRSNAGRELTAKGYQNKKGVASEGKIICYMVKALKS